MVELTTQIIGNGMTRCWKYNSKEGKYHMFEVPTHKSQVRHPREDKLWHPELKLPALLDMFEVQGVKNGS